MGCRDHSRRHFVVSGKNGSRRHLLAKELLGRVNTRLKSKVPVLYQSFAWLNPVDFQGILIAKKPEFGRTMPSVPFDESNPRVTQGYNVTRHVKGCAPVVHVDATDVMQQFRGRNQHMKNIVADERVLNTLAVGYGRCKNNAIHPCMHNGREY